MHTLKTQLQGKMVQTVMKTMITVAYLLPVSIFHNVAPSSCWNQRSIKPARAKVSASGYSNSLRFTVNMSHHSLSLLILLASQLKVTIPVFY